MYTALKLTSLAPRSEAGGIYGCLIDQHYRQRVNERQPLLHLILLDALHRSRAYATLLLPPSNDGMEISILTAIDSANQNVYELRDFFSQYGSRES